ncbi:uncharacterized protein LOC124372212 [Homalodisca vitripennis]|uniref:uncharacterized protein LOC124372212 n=1 Tax=Homalodisca vitripennis TaxID=197043 RepID=UPI001EEA54B7|nr:uncharacterized protein LOC124372212 [Homalodisca vitripennis]
MASWSKDNLLQFIEEFRKHECVWKVKSKDYHNREKKEAAHRSLLLVVKGFDSTATKSDVLKKINNIRSAFRKEQRKVTASQRSGSGTDDIYVPKLWYYRELLFLIDQEECLGGTSNLGEGRSWLILDNDWQQQKKKITTDAFGKNVAQKLRLLNNEQRIYAQKIINDALFEAELGGLTRFATVNPGILYSSSTTPSAASVTPSSGGRSTYEPMYDDTAMSGFSVNYTNLN